MSILVKLYNSNTIATGVPETCFEIMTLTVSIEVIAMFTMLFIVHGNY